MHGICDDQSTHQGSGTKICVLNMRKMETKPIVEINEKDTYILMFGAKSLTVIKRVQNIQKYKTYSHSFQSRAIPFVLLSRRGWTRFNQKIGNSFSNHCGAFANSKSTKGIVHVRRIDVQSVHTRTRTEYWQTDVLFVVRSIAKIMVSKANKRDKQRLYRTRSCVVLKILCA